MSLETGNSFTLETENPKGTTAGIINFVTLSDDAGNKTQVPFNEARLRQLIREAAHGFDVIDVNLITQETFKALYEGIPQKELMQAAIMATRSFIERDPAYSFVTARLLLQSTFEEVIGRSLTLAERLDAYTKYFGVYLETGISAGRLDPKLRQEFLLDQITARIGETKRV